MLAGITLKKKPHVGAETGMGAVGWGGGMCRSPPVWRVGSRGRCVLLMLAGMAGTIVVVATGGHPACPGGPAREVSRAGLAGRRSIGR